MNTNINWDRIPKVLHTTNFEISGDPDWDPYHLQFTDAVENAMAVSSEAVFERTTGDTIAQKIRGSAQDFPDFPMFKNYLFNHYYSNKRPKEAQKVVDECLKAHPDYFYNGIMQISLWIDSDADRAKIPGLMCDWDIVAYAGRNLFEEHEVRSYYLLAAKYCLRNIQVEEADGFVYFLEVACTEPDHPNIQALRTQVDQMQMLTEGMRKLQGLLGGRRKKK